MAEARQHRWLNTLQEGKHLKKRHKVLLLNINNKVHQYDMTRGVQAIAHSTTNKICLKKRIRHVKSKSYLQKN